MIININAATNIRIQEKVYTILTCKYPYVSRGLIDENCR